MPCFPFGFGSLALRKIQHEREACFLGFFKEGDADENREAAAILADEFLFEGGSTAGPIEHLDGVCIGLARFRRRDIRPPQRPGLQVVPRIPCHVQKSIIGFGNGALQVPEKHPDDVGIDQALDAGMVFPHVGIESRIFQRDGSLGGQQFQHLDPVRGKGMGGQIVFQVEQADQGGLAKNGQAQHGLGMLL